MAPPKVEVLGVYRWDVSDELLREQFETLYNRPMLPAEREDAEGQCREQLESIVLIEDTGCSQRRAADRQPVRVTGKERGCNRYVCPLLARVEAPVHVRCCHYCSHDSCS